MIEWASRCIAAQVLPYNLVVHGAVPGVNEDAKTGKLNHSSFAGRQMVPGGRKSRATALHRGSW